MKHREKLINLLNKLKYVIDSDERIESFECIGSVKKDCITNYSDLDITIYVEQSNIIELFNRKELENLLFKAGLKVLAINYDANMCIGLFDEDVIADIVFKCSNDSKQVISKPKAKEELLADICRIFWLDCFYFTQLLDDNTNFRWEAIRGLNAIRERHILKLIFFDKEDFPAFKKMNFQNEIIFNELSKTLIADDSSSAIKKAFENIIILFQYLYKNLDGPIISGIQDLQKNVYKNLIIK